MDLRVDLRAQYLALKSEIDTAMHRVLASGRYTLSEECVSFEREFGAYLGVSNVVALGDGTRAISLALKLAGVRPGDEVVTTAFTAVPTIGAILETGAIPIFADIDPHTFLIDIGQVERKITSRTRAVVPVHIFGNVVDIPELRRHLPEGMVVIEDAAQAHGSSLENRMAGSFGEAATFSFYPTKNLGGYGDGGALVTANDALATSLKRLRNHGMIDKDTCVDIGVNSRLDELQAAILRVKLLRLDEMNRVRTKLVDRYKAGLPDSIRPQLIRPGVATCWHVFECRVEGDRSKLEAALAAAEIQTNNYYVVPNHLQPAFRHLGGKPGDLPATEAVCKDAIAFPLYPEMQNSVVDRVLETVLAWSRGSGH